MLMLMMNICISYKLFLPKKLCWPWSYSYAHFAKSTAAKYTNRARIFSNELNAPVTGQKSLWTHIHLYVYTQIDNTRNSNVQLAKQITHNNVVIFSRFFGNKKNFFCSSAEFNVQNEFVFPKKATAATNNLAN